MILLYAHFLDHPQWDVCAPDWTSLDNACCLADFGRGIGAIEAIYVGY